MTELPAIADAARRLLSLGERGLLATLVGVRGSSYRPAGAMMLVTPAGHRIGGVSGGCLEEHLAREGARLVDSSGGPALFSFSTALEADDPEARDSATSSIPRPGCGGRLDVIVEPLVPAHVEFLDAMERIRAAGREATVVHRLEIAGARLAPHAVSARLRRALLCDGEILWRDAELSDRDLVSVDPTPDDEAFHGFDMAEATHLRAHRLDPMVDLLIFGAGDDAPALVRQAKLLGWRVTVLDRRLRMATTARFPEADVVRADAWDRIFQDLTPLPSACAVTMTHSFSDDAAVLAGLAPHRLNYVGLLGPRSRRDAVLAEAAVLGGPDVSLLAHVLRGPAGLDLGVKSPEAIAVSIVAEILAVTRGPRDGAPVPDVTRIGAPARAVDRGVP